MMPAVKGLVHWARLDLAVLHPEVVDSRTPVVMFLSTRLIPAAAVERHATSLARGSPSARTCRDECTVVPMSGSPCPQSATIGLDVLSRQEDVWTSQLIGKWCSN